MVFAVRFSVSCNGNAGGIVRSRGVLDWRGGVIFFGAVFQTRALVLRLGGD